MPKKTKAQPSPTVCTRIDTTTVYQNEYEHGLGFQQTVLSSSEQTTKSFVTCSFKPAVVQRL